MPTERDLSRKLDIDTTRGIVRMTYRDAIMLADRLTETGDTAGSDRIVAQLHLHFPADLAPRSLALQNLVRDRRHADAVPAADELVGVTRDNPTVQSLCVRTYRQAGRNRRALALAEDVVRHHPAAAVARHELGLCLLSAGREDEALDAFNEALRLDPDFIPSCWSRARIAVGRLDDGQIAWMEARLARPGLSDETRSMLEFALAWAVEDVDPDRHFRLLTRANARLAALHPWDAAAERARLERMRRRFGAGFADRTADFAVAGPAPIFIVGLPRSGTSLVEQILAAHADVTGCGETGGLDRAVAATATAHGLDPDITTWDSADGPGRLFAALDAEYRQILDFYLAGSADRPFTDKSLGSEWLVGLALAMYPRARIVHCTRHPLDICLSLYRLYFTTGQHYSYRLDWIAEACLIHAELMAHWRRLFPGRIVEIRYEALVAGQRDVTESLLAFCGLDWQESCLHFYRQERAARTASDSQIKKPLYGSAVGRWKPYAKYLREAAEILGVDLD